MKTRHAVALVGILVTGLVVFLLVLDAPRKSVPNLRAELDEIPHRTLSRSVPSELMGSVNLGKGRELDAGVQNTNVPSDSSVSAAVREIVTAKRERPKVDVLLKLTERDETSLIEAYRQETNILDKVAITSALSFIGGDPAAEVLFETLVQDYGGRRLESGRQGESSDEESIFFSTVGALGLIAQRSDKAYEIITNGTSSRYWKDRISWSSRREDDTIGMLTAFSIHGVGWSGRGDAVRFLDELRQRDLRNDTATNPLRVRRYEGTLVDTAFYLHLADKHGIEFLRRLAFESDRIHPLYEAWRETDEGKNWFIWAMRKKGHAQ